MESPDNSKWNGKDKYLKPTGLSDVKFTKGTSVPESKSETKDKHEVPSISFITLFRFASSLDIFYIVVAVISSIIAAITTPIATLLMANLLQAMVDYGVSVYDGAPDGETFLNAVQSFAIYNSINGLVLMSLSYVATTLMNIASYKQAYTIRQEYLKATLNQDFAYFDIYKTGDIASKVNSDVLKLEEGIGEKLSTFVFYQAAFLSSIIMALIKGWKLALLCLISLPITMFLVGASGLVASRLSKKESAAMAKAGAIAEEVLSAIRTVYAFSGQTKELDRYAVHLKDARKHGVMKGFLNGLVMGFLYLCMFCSSALSFWFGYRLIVNEPENYDVSTMMAVFFGVMSGTESFGISSTLLEVFGSARGAGAQIFSMIDNIPTINPLLNQGTTPSSIEGNIELKNVVFHYPSRPDVPILKGINLTVKRGQSVALVGHSGCGKSTIIQLLSRFYDVIDGEVRIDGNDVRQLSVRWLREKIGLVGQEPVLFNTTVRENIRYGRENATNEEIEECARQANAHKFIMKLPQGYDTLVGERGASLSGGQKQRIAIARALIRNPSILLLDEATSALDTSSEYKVQKALDKAQEGRTTIVVAHRLSTIRNVDVIYVFKSGEIVEFGGHEDLMNKKDETKGLNREVSVISKQEDGDNYQDQKSTINDEDTEATSDVSFWNVIKLNKPEWKVVTVASICSLMSGFAMPLISVIFGDFIGDLSNPNVDEVQAAVRRYVIIFVGIGFYSGITNFLIVYLYGIAGEFLTERLRWLMFEKLLQQEIAFYDDRNNSTGALCAKLSGEAAAVQGATGRRIGTILQAVGTFAFALVLSLIYEWRVGLIVLVFVPIIVLMLYKESRMTFVDSSSTAKTMEASSKVAVEAVANVRTVASLGREETFRNEYGQKLLPALDIATRGSHWRGVVFSVSRGIFSFVIAIAMYYGGTIIVNEGVDYSLVYKSTQVLLMGAASAAEAFAFTPNFHKGIKAAGRIIMLLKRQSKITDPAQPAVNEFNCKGEASLHNVKFRYVTRPNVQVLSDFNLDIKKCQTVALVGTSGCGKSTVIQLLERYYDPEDGVVAQDGISLPKLRLVDSRKGIGFVQQEPILFDLTIGENIAYGGVQEPTMDDIIDAAKKANIHNFFMSLPLGYETNIGSKGTQLSGGQKQRIAIARALIRRPKILLLDEATSALDTESEKVVQEALDAAKAGCTCLMIAHRLSTVRDADVICVVNHGQIAEMGKHEELMELKGLYYNLNRRGFS